MEHNLINSTRDLEQKIEQILEEFNIERCDDNDLANIIRINKLIKKNQTNLSPSLIQGLYIKADNIYSKYFTDSSNNRNHNISPLYLHRTTNTLKYGNYKNEVQVKKIFHQFYQEISKLHRDTNEASLPYKNEEEIPYRYLSDTSSEEGTKAKQKKCSMM